MLIAKAYLFRRFGDAGVDRLHLALSFSPLWFNHTGRLCLHFRIIFDLLKNQEMVPSIDWSHFLSQVGLGLPLGWTLSMSVRNNVGATVGSTEGEIEGEVVGLSVGTKIRTTATV